MAAAPGSIPTTEVVRKAVAKTESGVAIGKSSIPIEKTVEAWITDQGIQAIESMAGKPFLVTVSMPAPHAPWIVNDPYYSMYDRARIELPDNRKFVEPVDRKTNSWILGTALGDEGLREYLGAYYGMCSMVDWNVGRLLDALARLKLENDTLVIFMADHGDMQAGHMMYGKLNYSMYEETTRIPLLMRLPGRMPAGKVVETQAGSCDIHPTILDYLGMKQRAPVHGCSLRPYIEGHEDPARPIFIEHDRGKANFQRAIRTLAWTYVYSSSGESQLYHLEKDPGETKNLIADTGAAPTRKKLHADLVQWMRETDDPRAAQIS
jgi:arylsulfatase A-like enzyme